MLAGLDMSPEEMRWKAMEAQMRGDMNTYVGAQLAPHMECDTDELTCR